MQHSNTKIEKTLSSLVSLININQQTELNQFDLISSYPQFHELTQQLKEDKRFEMFGGYVHWFGGHGIEANYDTLAAWMTRKSLNSSINNTLLTLENYISLNKIPMMYIGILESSIDTRFTFCNEVEIFPEKVNIGFPTNIQSASNQPLAIIKTKFEHPVNVFKEMPNGEVPKEPFEKMNDVVNCLNLALPPTNGIHLVLTGSFLGDEIETPFEQEVIGGWRLPSEKRVLMRTSINIPKLKEADKYLQIYSHLERSKKKYLNITLDRLNRVGYIFNYQDKAIDLRICMESLFLGADNNDHQQLRYRIALRAAKFLGKSTSERKELFKDFKDCYDLTSTVIHQGVFPNKKSPALIDKIAGLVKIALIKIMENNGNIDWQDVELA